MAPYSLRTHLGPTLSFFFCRAPHFEAPPAIAVQVWTILQTEKSSPSFDSAIVSGSRTGAGAALDTRNTPALSGSKPALRLELSFGIVVLKTADQPCCPEAILVRTEAQRVPLRSPAGG